ncbi:MAG: hypothetical protein NC548_05670 [Lachnospiraceae bacterium]|nr:hypothetical protein [Lachnospiraceae bacterium]
MMVPKRGGGQILDSATEGLMDAAKGLVDRIIKFILKAIDFVAGKAAAMGALIKKMRPMSKKDAIAAMSKALGERDRAIAERDKAISERDRARQDTKDALDDAHIQRKEKISTQRDLLDAAAKMRDIEFDRNREARKAKREGERADAAEKEVERLSRSDTQIDSLSRKQGAAVLRIFEETNKLLNMCWQFMERDSTHLEKFHTRQNTTQYRGEDDEPLPDKSNADYGKFDHDCERIAQAIAEQCKDAQLNKCIVVTVENREKLGDMLMKKAEQLRDYKEKFEKIRDKIASTGFGKEKVKRINSITKNLNYVISTVTTIAASMQKSICVDLASAA